MMNRLMKGSRALTFVLALALMFSLTACDDDPVSPGNGDDDGDGNGDDPTLLIDVINSEDDLSGLSTALEDFDIVGDLDDPALVETQGIQITVFAPSNEAFQEIVDLSEVEDSPLVDDAGELFEEIVAYHVTDSEVLSGDLSDGQTITPLRAQGEDGDPDAELRVSIDDDESPRVIRVNGALVSTRNLTAENGVIHIIDGLMLENRTLVERFALTSSTEALLDAALGAGVGEDFGADETWTIFAPINEAFDDIDTGGLSPDELETILNYHIIDSDELSDIDGPIDASTLQDLLANSNGELSVATKQGEELTFTQTEDGIEINGGQATLVEGGLDRFTDNFSNVFHLIDDLLMPPSMQESNTIADIVSGDDNFETLRGALQDAGLVNVLADEEETFTVFAPDNDAFGPINTDVLLGQADDLEAVLGYHVVPDQALAASDLAEGENTVQTLAGDELTVVRNGDDVFVEGSQVTNANVNAENGVIHVIDRALLGNQNLANAAWFVDETEQLYNTVVDFGLRDDFVDDTNSWTVFGPNNATFESADLSGFSEEEVQQVLQYHVYAESAVDSEGLVGLLEGNNGTVTIPTLQGEDLTITQDGDQIVFNGGQATLDMANLDYVASNGILHVIEGLLLPPSIATTTLLEEDFSDEAADPFSVVDVESGGNSWQINSFEDEPRSPYMRANGFGADAPSNTWLISPALDFSANSGQTLSFANAKNFGDEGLDRGLVVQVSTDYDGTGNPEQFTWTDISDRVENYSEGGYEFVESGEIDISDEDFQSESVYVAFQYISSGTGGGSTELWQVDDVNVTAQR